MTNSKKIAIHHRPGSFSERWIEYCKVNHILYKIVNAYSDNIIKQVSDCNAFMWHHHHANYKDKLFAKELIYSIEKMGIKVFPDFNTTWHFDDKVGQKYLLEALGAPLVPCCVFYEKREALEWIEHAHFPLVFKLRSGAGSANVQLISTRQDAVHIIDKAFGSGFAQFNRYGNLKEKIRKYREGKGSLLAVFKGLIRVFVSTEYSKMAAREKGYVYFQDFIPSNDFDIRIIVIGGKAFGIKRFIRKNDFRASGSGNIIYDKNEIDERCVKIAFDVNKKIQSQCIAYDFVFDEHNTPLILEISYGFTPSPYDACEGYWDKDIEWHKGKFNPYGWMVEQVL
jgi:glutathione synthase/RimK-type ligase-like ATP-grasp enzyme